MLGAEIFVQKPLTVAIWFHIVNQPLVYIIFVCIIVYIPGCYDWGAADL